jgi:anion-transporting  ArsA/GET3 family ATPase
MVIPISSLRTVAFRGGSVDSTHVFATSRLVIVVGKGGVGKTTVTATIARAAAGRGRNVLVVETEPNGPLARCFERPVCGYEASLLWGPDSDDGTEGRVWGRAITPTDALHDYLSTHGLGLLVRSSSRRGAPNRNRGGIDVLATAAPGIEDLLVLGKVRAIDAEAVHDLIVVDGPAAGHAVSLLRAAAGLLEIVRSGPIHDQAVEVSAMLRDPHRCQVVLVTTAEETPVNETIDTAFTIEDDLGVQLGPIVVNKLETESAQPGPLAGRMLERLISDADPELTAPEARAMASAAVRAARYRTDLLEAQARNLTRLSESLGLPQISLPRLATKQIGPGELAILASWFARPAP